MPVRLLHEKGIDYYNQWKKLQKDHKNCNDLKDNAERLSGMKKTDHFYPVLQIVIYFGQEHWRAAFKMDDLTGANDFPEELQKLFFETPMLLFEVYYFKNIHWFQTDLQQVCGFLQRTNELNQKLVSAGRINDLLQASNNKKYRKELMAELGIA